MRHISSIENTSDGHTVGKQIEGNEADPFGKGYRNERSEACSKLSHYIIVNYLEWFISLPWLWVVFSPPLYNEGTGLCNSIFLSEISMNLNILNCITNQIALWCSLKLTTRWVASAAFCEDLCTCQCQTPHVTGPGLPVRSYKVIHGWWLSLLSWVCRGEAELHIEPSFH